MARPKNEVVLDVEEIEEVEVAPTSVKQEKKPVVTKKIPVHSIPGKALDVTEFGYQFENIHIRNDIPLNALILAFENRLGEGEKADHTKEEFFMAKSQINRYLATQPKARVRYLNGVISYGTENWTVPNIGAEVFLRVIEDRLKTDRKIKGFFTGKEEAQWAQAVSSARKTGDRLAA